MEPEIQEYIYSAKSVSSIVSARGLAATGRLLKTVKEQDLLDSLHEFCDREFTKKRIIISNRNFSLAYWGKEASYLKFKDCSMEWIEILLRKTIDSVYEEQKKIFISENKKQMDIRSDVWTLCFLKGPSLNKRTFYFDKINRPTLRYEVKLYYRELFENVHDFRDDRGIALVTAGLNFISQKREILHFADVTVPAITDLIISFQNGQVKTEHRKKYSVNSIRKMVQRLSAINDFLIKVGQDPVPAYNHFSEYSFRNVDSMESNADCIPENVAFEIYQYLDEMSESYRLIYKIFMETGIHAKEIIFLETKDLSPSQFEEFWKIRYIQYKNLWRCNENGCDPRKLTLISKELASEILEFIDNTKTIRERSQTDFIFVSGRAFGSESRFTLPQITQFVASVNRIIDKHNITDGGIKWHFTSRQARKTIAVQMAENGATAAQIAITLSHADIRTSEKYYAEVRQKKLAEMNSEFFKKKFYLQIGEDTLAKFTEDERKDLYIEFSMGLREVEFGQCSRHLSEGPCGRGSFYDCATCPKLCTGKKYLTKWEKAYESHNSIVNSLIEKYEKEDIPPSEYGTFMEFKKEVKVRDHVKYVIDAIQENSDE